MVIKGCSLSLEIRVSDIHNLIYIYRYGKILLSLKIRVSDVENFPYICSFSKWGFRGAPYPIFRDRDFICT